MSENPLKGYFRTPGIHTSIPSGGRFNDKNDIDLSINDELEIFPMTAADEIITKNPDSLLNGRAIEKILQSCVPGVKHPLKLPSQDVDVLLLAIKKCTFGNSMEVNTVCPECKKEMAYTTSINHILSTMKPLDKEYTVRLSDEMVVHLRPYDYEAITKMNLAAFEETKLYQYLIDTSSDEKSRLDYFSESFEKISSLNLELLADSIMKVVIPDGAITNKEHILEFIKNTTADNVKKLREKMKEMEDRGIDKNLKIECSDCKHEWETVLQFDASNFFA